MMNKKKNVCNHKQTVQKIKIEEKIINYNNVNIFILNNPNPIMK